MGHNDTKCLFLSNSTEKEVVKVNQRYLSTGTYREQVNRPTVRQQSAAPRGVRAQKSGTFSRIRMSGIRRPISRVLCRPTCVGRGGHSSGPAIAGRFSRPTRTARAGEALPKHKAWARRPYSVLLQAGLAMPSPSPGPRWALTPPFHPYPPCAPASAGGRFAFCGAIPGLAPGGRYPPPFRRGARTFLPLGLNRESDRPAV